MLNPTLSQKNGQSLSSPTIDDRAKRLFQLVYSEQHQEEKDDDTPKIKVSTLISRLSFYYEKIRNTVDYKEEHLLRKNAIERILKREIIIQGVFQEVKSSEVAKHLLTELIRAAYLPNNKIPETKIEEVTVVISKYMALRKYGLKNLDEENPFKKELSNWVIGIAASEIEEQLGRSEVVQSIVEYMYETMQENIQLEDDIQHQKDKEIQIYLSIHRDFLKFDRDMLSFILLKYYNKGWKSAGEQQIMDLAKNIGAMHEAMNFQLEHPLNKQIDRLASRYTVLFSILRDVIEDDPVGVFNSIKHDPKAFPRAIKRICEKRYKDTGSKLWRAAVRSILYIFVTKSILVFILEIPATTLFGEAVNYMSLAINITFPPFLLFLIVMFTPLPSEDNTKKIIEGIGQIIFVENERKEPYKLKAPIEVKHRMNTFFTILYSFTFFISFGIVIWILKRINFNFVSIIIFLFFLTLISFFSIRIRKRVRELIIVDVKESVLSLFADFFYTPILAVGKFISERFSKINVFIFILDFIIEAPFKIFVEIAEEWSKYVKSRRDQI